MSTRALTPAASAPGWLGTGLLVGVPLVAAGAAVAVGPVAVAIPLLIVVVAFFLREPTALLALYLEVGLFKNEAVVSSLPVDATTYFNSGYAQFNTGGGWLGWDQWGGHDLHDSDLQFALDVG